MGGTFAVLDYGPQTRILGPNQTPYGANMAMRLSSVRGYRFDPTLGKTKNQILPGEETTFFRRLVAAGHTGVWVGPARVRHDVPPERVTEAWVSRFFVELGEVDARQNRVEGRYNVLGVPTWLIRRYLMLELKMWAHRPFRSRTWLRYLRSSSFTRGSIRELAGRRRRRGSGLLEAPPLPPHASVLTDR